MSEMKWNWVYYPYLDAPNKQEESALKAGYIKVVIKDEADKVIAELEDKLQNVSELLKETREWLIESLIESQKMHKRCADNAIKKIRHQKFKRCVAMAKMCGIMSAFEDGEWYAKWINKWCKRWLELAEKFKEAK